MPLGTTSSARILEVRASENYGDFTGEIGHGKRCGEAKRATAQGERAEMDQDAHGRRLDGHTVSYPRSAAGPRSRSNRREHPASPCQVLVGERAATVPQQEGHRRVHGGE